MQSLFTSLKPIQSPRGHYHIFSLIPVGLRYRRLFFNDIARSITATGASETYIVSLITGKEILTTLASRRHYELMSCVSDPLDHSFDGRC
jgi:hypothetical protein